jgi:biopolymer transport protein ExbD
MSWQLRHEGSPEVVKGLSQADIVQRLRDGLCEPTDEVLAPGQTSWQPLEQHAAFAEVIEELEPAEPIHREEATSLDMNALIDVCLVLLIFFILTTTYAAAVQKVVPLPTVKADGPKTKVVRLEDVKKRMIRVQAYLDRGKPVLRVENQTVDVLGADGTSIDPDKLRDALRPFVRGEDGKTEVLLDARGVTWGDVIAIQDGAKAARVHTIHHLLRRSKVD